MRFRACHLMSATAALQVQPPVQFATATGSDRDSSTAQLISYYEAVVAVIERHLPTFLPQLSSLPPSGRNSTRFLHGVRDFYMIAAYINKNLSIDLAKQQSFESSLEAIKKAQQWYRKGGQLLWDDATEASGVRDCFRDYGFLSSRNPPDGEDAGRDPDSSVAVERFMEHSQYSQIAPTCVLDFYVHESCQRKGDGRRLFDAMLAHGDDRFSHVRLSGWDPQGAKLDVFEEYGDADKCATFYSNEAAYIRDLQAERCEGNMFFLTQQQDWHDSWYRRDKRALPGARASAERRGRTLHSLHPRDRPR